MTPNAEAQSEAKALCREPSIGQRVLIAVVSLVLLGSCESELTVGVATQDAGSCAGCVVEQMNAGTDECSEQDASKLSTYQAWRSAPNQLSLLAGTTWSGYIETGPDISLTVERNQVAFLSVGPPPFPEPSATEGYLCDEQEACRGIDLFEGGVYPIHGGSFDSRRLEFVLNPYSAFDAWCQLQAPKLRPDAVPEPCQYDLLWTAAFGSPCLADGAPVSCQWLEIARSLSPCECTSGSCFSLTEWTPDQTWDYGDGFRIDLTYDADEESLFGSILSYLPCCPGEVFRAVRLWRAD